MRRKEPAARARSTGRVTLPAINDALAARGISARLKKGAGYFYFSGGEAAGWLDLTVNTDKVTSLTLEQWVAEFARLKKLNRDILRGPLAPQR